MAGWAERWLVTASLVGLLGSPSAALAQAGRPWVDPPSESEAKTQPPAQAPASLPAPPAQAAVPDSATPPVPSPPESKASAASPAAEASSRKTAADGPTKQKASADRKVRARSQQASSSARNQRREVQVVRRRATGAQISQAEPRNAIERRARVTRYGSIREGMDSGLQVMRLRTIQLPDGRRIDILTRPDQDIASGLPDGY